MNMLLLLVVCIAVSNRCPVSARTTNSDYPHCLSTNSDFEGILVTCQLPQTRPKPRCEFCVLYNDINTNESLDAPTYNITQQNGYNSGWCNLVYYPGVPGNYSFVIEIFPFRDILRTNKVLISNFPTLTLEKLTPPLFKCSDSDVTLNCTWLWQWKPDRINLTLNTDSDVYLSTETRQYRHGKYFIYELISKFDFGFESRNTVVKCNAQYGVIGNGRRTRHLVKEITIPRPRLGVMFKLDTGNIISRKLNLLMGSGSNIICTQTGGVESRAVTLNVSCVGSNLNVLYHGISTSRVSFSVYGNETYDRVICKCTLYSDRDSCISETITVRVVTEAYSSTQEHQGRIVKLNPVFQHVNGTQLPEMYSVSKETNSSVQCNVISSHRIKLQINVTCWDISGRTFIKLSQSTAPVLFNLHGDQTSERTLCLCTATSVALSTVVSAQDPQSSSAVFVHQINLSTSTDLFDTPTSVLGAGRSKISIVSAYYLLAGVIAIVLLPLVIASIVYLCLSCREANILYSSPNSGSNSEQTRSSNEYESISNSPKSSSESSARPPQVTEPLLDSSSNDDSQYTSDSCSSVQVHRYYNTTSDDQNTSSDPTPTP